MLKDVSKPEIKLNPNHFSILFTLKFSMRAIIGQIGWNWRIHLLLDFIRLCSDLGDSFDASDSFEIVIQIAIHLLSLNDRALWASFYTLGKCWLFLTTQICTLGETCACRTAQLFIHLAQITHNKLCTSLALHFSSDTSLYWADLITVGLNQGFGSDWLCGSAFR